MKAKARAIKPSPKFRKLKKGDPMGNSLKEQTIKLGKVESHNIVITDNISHRRWTAVIKQNCRKASEN